tara:strand:+ start:4235 stop:6142 length:1908 start_codon:yes stop_codon:yes gene_type:complete
MPNFGYKVNPELTATAPPVANTAFVHGLGNSAYTDNSINIEHTASAGDVITEVHVYIRDNYGTAGSVRINVYEWVGGTATNRVLSQEITGITSLGWYSVTGLSTQLTDGVTYRVGITSQVDVRPTRSTAYVGGSIRDTSDNPDPFSELDSYNNTYQCYAVAATSALSVTGPDSLEQNAASQIAGAALDSVTALSLRTSDLAYSIAQTITLQNAATIDFTTNTGIASTEPGVPVSGIPMTPTVSAVGISAFELEFVVDNGGEVARSITIDPPSTHEVIQTTLIQADTDSGESIFASDLIAVEDNMQAYVPKSVNGMNITWSANGNFTTDIDQTETIEVVYFSPTNGQWSAIDVTIKAISADTTPDAFNLGVDVIGAEPAATVTRSQVVTGIATGQSITISATDSAQVSIDNLTFGASVSRQVNETFYVRLVASATPEAVVNGGAEANGVSDSFTITTRAANGPVITTQPADPGQLTAGDSFTLTVVATNAATYQWYKNGSLLSGETGSSYSAVALFADDAAQYYCVLTSSEGSTAQTVTIALSVIEAAVAVQIETAAIQNINTKSAIVGADVGVIVRDQVTLANLLSVTVTTNAQGVAVISSSQDVIGVAGTTVLLDFYDAASGQRHMYPATIEAV